MPVTSVALAGRDGAPLDDGSGLPVAHMLAALAGLVAAAPSVADTIMAADAIKARLRADGQLFTSVGDPQIAPDGADGPAMFAALQRIVRPLQGLRNPRLRDLERASLLASDIAGCCLIGKAFDPSEPAGDSGCMACAGLRHDHATTLRGKRPGAQLYAIRDYAGPRFNGASQPDGDDLVSAGAGLRQNDDRTNLELDVDAPLRGPVARASSGNPRFFFNLTRRF